jgi:type II secretory pathway pseudopilin PulG
LVEVVVAVLLLSIGITAVFSVCLSVRFKANRDVYRTQMDFYARQLLEELKSYVTADMSVTDGAPGTPASWCHPKDTGCPGGWALADNVVHDVTDMLPSSLSSDHPAGVKARLWYTVTLVPMTAGSANVNARRVDITMTWDTLE